MSPIKLLTYTSLFPNSQQPRFGVFVENRLRHLLAHFPVASHVVAPVPRFPLQRVISSQYGKLCSVPQFERRNGLEVWHPRFQVWPGLSWRISPHLMYRATLPVVRKLHRTHHFDAIDAHFVYPDGVAAVMLARKLGLPVVITARGTDINLMPHFYLPRRYIRWALTHCDQIITVSQALKDKTVSLGIDPEKIQVLRNGVDTRQFRFTPDSELRASLNLPRLVMLTVGNLVEFKGHQLAIEALVDLPEVGLMVVGEGPYEPDLKQLAQRLGVADRVRFTGAVAHYELARYYSLADALVLASEREGWPNVLLEAMACGTRVIATRVGGTAEIVTCPQAGRLMQSRSVRALLECWHDLQKVEQDRETTRAYADAFGWEPTSNAQYTIFRRLTPKVVSHV